VRVRTALLIACALVLIFAAPFIPRLFRSGLRIQLANSTPWVELVVYRPDLSEPLRTAFAGKLITVPLKYGLYRFYVHFPQSQTFCFEYFHTDAGDTRWVDLEIGPMKADGVAHFRLLGSRWLVSGASILFEGDIQASEATKDQPKRLFGP
jgi:hypothetical protein